MLASTRFAYLSTGEQIDNPCFFRLNELGAQHLKMQHLDEGKVAYRELLAVCLDRDMTFLGYGLFGMVQVAAARGNREEARRLGEESLTKLEGRETLVANTVKEWLKTL